MNDTIMAEEMQPEKKVAFVNRPYSNEERIKKDEEELEQLLKEQRGEEEATEEVEEEPTKVQKRKHSRSVTLIFVVISNNKLKSLSKRLMNCVQLSAATKKEMKLPKSDEDLKIGQKTILTLLLS